MLKNKKLDKGFLSVILLLLFAVLMLFLPYYKLNNTRFGPFKIVIPEYDKLATFISGITAPFLSLAAFILLYLTYKSQRQELADSKVMLAKQHKTLQQQRFEGTFFSLLNLHNTIVSDMKFSKILPQFAVAKGFPKIIENNGRLSFQGFFEQLKSALFGKKDFQKGYISFFEGFEYELGHYFRNLYHIIKFVDQSEIDDKQKYASLVRAQLSTYEQVLIFYNCLSVYGARFKPYIEDYHLLKNMNPHLIFDKSHLDLYKDSAYGTLGRNGLFNFDTPNQAEINL